jgi:hypothetical protein
MDLRNLLRAEADDSALGHSGTTVTVVDGLGNSGQYGSVTIGAEPCSDDVIPASSDSYDERRVLIASNVRSISPAELNRLGASLTYFVA